MKNLWKRRWQEKTVSLGGVDVPSYEFFDVSVAISKHVEPKAIVPHSG